MENISIIILFVTLIIVIISTYVLLKKNYRLKIEQDKFLLNFTNEKIPDKAAKEYEELIQSIFKKAKNENNWPSRRFLEDKLLDPRNSWHNALKQEDKEKLKDKLRERAKIIFPLLISFSKELQRRKQLFERGLFAECQIKKTNEIKNWVDQEIMLIKREAESLKAGWGKDNNIFKECANFPTTNVLNKQK